MLTNTYYREDLPVDYLHLDNYLLTNPAAGFVFSLRVLECRQGKHLAPETSAEAEVVRSALAGE